MTSRSSRIPEQTYLFDSLGSKPASSSRKAHIRRLVDVLQLTIQRNDWPRAKRAWSILARCKEFDWKKMWKTGLLLSGTMHVTSGSEGDPKKLEYLRVLMLQCPENRVSILQEIILRLIADDRYQDALDELELYLPSFPYQDSPALHIYAGLLCLFLSQPSDNQAGDVLLQGNDLQIQSGLLDQGLLRECKSHFHRALDIDPENIVASAFLDKLTASKHDAEESDTGNDSEELSDMEITMASSNVKDTGPSNERRDEV